MDNEQKQKGKINVEEMMEVYKTLATPGPPHKMLASLAGSWTTRTKAWMEPDKPPVEGMGICEQKMLLDGRYLQQEYAGEMMGDPFSGINVIGYDNHIKKICIHLDRLHEHRHLLLEGTEARMEGPLPRKAVTTIPLGAPWYGEVYPGSWARIP